MARLAGEFARLDILVERIGDAGIGSVFVKLTHLDFALEFGVIYSRICIPPALDSP